MVQEFEPTNAFNVMVGLDVLLGLALCFFGYLIFRVRIAIGLILGCALAANVAFAIFQNPWVALAAGIAGGLLGAVLSSVFYFAAIFLVGAFLGGLLGGVLAAALSRQDLLPWMSSLGAIIAGAAAVLLRQLRVFVTILATAVGGAGWAVLATFGFIVFKLNVPVSWTSEALPAREKIFLYAALLVWILLSAAGMIVQYKFLPSPEKPQAGKPLEDKALLDEEDTRL